jgi:molybdopterin-guanine dinucleotide biosynthesis protein A
VIPGILLTGGASSRMGRDKATMEVDGEALGVRAARVLQAVCDPVIEVGPGVTSLRAIREDPPGAGPLAALLAGAAALDTHGPVLLLACDLPFMTAELLHALANWPGDGTVVPVVDGRLQYACARYGPAALDEALASFRSGGRALQSAADSDCEYLNESNWAKFATEKTFVDVDTPDDLRRLGLS